MSFDIPSALAEQKLNDYGSLVTAIAVGYDYCLTFSDEINYIWTRPWTRVSVLYLLIRYMGCLSVLMLALIGSTFIPGPLEVCHSPAIYTSPMSYARTAIACYDIRRIIITYITLWTRAVFLVCADLVMVLRVYAMYNRSRIILGVLLVLYISEVVTLLLSSGIYSDPKYTAVFTVQLLDLTVCDFALSTPKWNTVSTMFQFVLGTALCALVIAKFSRDMLQVYRATRIWQLNKYMSLLARDGVFYFLVSLLYGLLNMLGHMGDLPQEGWASQVLTILADVPLYTMTPRFVMNVRELYVRDTQGHWEHDIDTGFGLSSRTGTTLEGSTTFGSIAFVNSDTACGLYEGEEMTTLGETARNGGRQVLTV